MPTNGKMSIIADAKQFTLQHSKTEAGEHTVVLRTSGEKEPKDFWCSSRYNYLPTKIITYYDSKTMAKMSEYNINYNPKNALAAIDSWTIEKYDLSGSLTEIGNFNVVEHETPPVDDDFFLLQHEPGMTVAKRRQSATIQDNNPFNADFFLADTGNKLIAIGKVPVTPAQVAVIATATIFIIALLLYIVRMRNRISAKNNAS